MADAAHQEDRTEAATPRRLQRAREEGQAPLSREVQTLAGLVAATLALFLAGGNSAHDLVVSLGVFFSQARSIDLAGGTGLYLAWVASLHAAAPVVLATLAGGTTAVLLQTGFLLHGGALRPDFTRINPNAGLRRLLGPDNLIEAIKSTGKIALVGLIIWLVLRADVAVLALEPRRNLNGLLQDLSRTALHVLLAVIAVQSVIAVLDLSWVRMRHARRLRMSRNDVREEQREAEGDPRIKARIKQIRMLRARRRMLAAVPKATVVITNPTHYAVALTYDRAKTAAPRVIAKGVDSLAARIRETAETHKVPLVANPPLARALYRVELDQEIPAEHYKAVAEIIAYVWRLGRSAQLARAST